MCGLNVSYTQMTHSEPIFADLLWSPGIDSQPGGPVRQPYFSYRPARLHRLAKPIPRSRFLGSINVNKYGLCTHHVVERTEPKFLNFLGAQEPISRNNSARLCSQAGRYNNPIPTWFLAPIEIPALN
jgi:hypothetical protein